jgi:uncharacterized SAM-binding protein YcdF (DUF218 family)
LPRKSRVFVPVIAVICLAVIFVLSSGRILWSLGAVLDNNEPPQKADMIVVIGGDQRGNRILKAAELARQGYAASVLVSGVATMYGHHESDLAIDFAVHHGYARGIFVANDYPAVSTLDEARADIRELRRLGVHKYLLVTSVYHSARATRIFRREGRDLEMHPVSAPDRYWPNGVWWNNREGRKLWFNEMLKTGADYLGI